MTTAHPLQIGLVATGGRAEIASLERHPIDSLWVGGHIASPNPSPEAMQSLARLVAVTERVRVGTSVLLLPLYPPALIAKQIADLDQASRGRITLGVGIGGEYPAEFDAMHVPRHERGPRTDEAIALLRALWTAEPVTHDGRFYPMKDIRIHPSPRQPGGPPIVIGGRKEPAMRRAARQGDGWFPYLYSPERYAASIETVRREAAEIERDLSSFEWLLFLFVNIEPDGRSARATATRSLGGTYDQDFAAFVDRVAAAGTSDQVTERVRQFYDVGVRHFVFCPATAENDPRPVVDRLLGDVIPALRDYADHP